jgi:hypothetical protein
MPRRLTKDSKTTELSTGRIGSVSGVTSIYVAYASLNTSLNHGRIPDPLWGATIDVFDIGGRRAQISDRWWVLLAL